MKSVQFSRASLVPAKSSIAKSSIAVFSIAVFSVLILLALGGPAPVAAQEADLTGPTLYKIDVKSALADRLTNTGLMQDEMVNFNGSITSTTYRLKFDRKITLTGTIEVGYELDIYRDMGSEKPEKRWVGVKTHKVSGTHLFKKSPERAAHPRVEVDFDEEVNSIAHPLWILGETYFCRERVGGMSNLNMKDWLDKDERGRKTAEFSIIEPWNGGEGGGSQ